MMEKNFFSCKISGKQKQMEKDNPPYFFISSERMEPLIFH